MPEPAFRAIAILRIFDVGKGMAVTDPPHHHLWIDEELAPARGDG